MKNKIEDLRNHLFATIEGLLDEKNPLAIDRAKAVAQVAQVMVNAARAETEYLFKIAEREERSPFMAPHELPAPGTKRPRLVSEG